MKKYIIITSISELNKVMQKFASLKDWKLVLVGDRKGPNKIEDDRIIFLDIESQSKLAFNYCNYCPENHYSRKNIGYLYAMSLGADIIAESDDDNMPKEGWGESIDFELKELKIFEKPKYFNVYTEFTDKKIWPRGFPLENILELHEKKYKRQKSKIGIWQQLADNSPDVDAIYRLIHGEPTIFQEGESFALDKHVYCPFNSQNTFWVRDAFPLMYLPISVTFRFTDILRGYIAQRLLWENDLLLGFGDATVWQDRNKHDLVQDFRDEIPMYINIHNIIKKLDTIQMKETMVDSLLYVYQVLSECKIVKETELDALKTWVKDIKTLGFA
ncbi:STELLO glycosyltransferase family protein [Thermodesulfobacteriota bacterium]